ncbi:hypothetical protein F8M41_018555 [Gigaspora margarita]|uniref:Uncharacterized protein n=1 Tax=Gigaspora margarita TaxID=4874 RepID=A0A8H4ALL3_GIGMA|nr:hypothetical protein F8M41_018555 [Gigaspora margarita]
MNTAKYRRNLKVSIISFILGFMFSFFTQHMVLFYNTVPYTVPLQENMQKNFEQTNVIFIYQKNRTDDTFYKMLSYSDNIIFIGDQRWKCIMTPCLELQHEYSYNTLHLKLVDTLTQLLSQFPNARTFSKLDDDGLIHPYLYYDLVNKFELNNYAGILTIYDVDNIHYKYIFMRGVFYMLGREIAECFLRNNLVENSIGEDIFLGKIVSNYCNAKFIDLNDANMIWHKRYNLGKNKNCNLA